MKDNKLINIGQSVLQQESEAISELSQHLDASFTNACNKILQCTGRIVVLGMGKSGHIGHKIAATLASTGTPAFFVHPAEANHGDLGMLSPDDVVLILSNSGETAEIMSLLPSIKQLKIELIAITCHPHSTLAKAAEVHLHTPVKEEACPLGLAPTTSTTVMLALGDALAIALLKARGFSSKDFAFVHPAGTLGKKLLLRVSDIMQTGAAIPAVLPTATLKDSIIEMSAKRLGMVCIINKDQLLGIFTDGDLRRTLEKQEHINKIQIKDVMTQASITIGPNMLAIEALNLMEQHQITCLIALDDNKKPVGIIHLHALLQTGLA